MPTKFDEAFAKVQKLVAIFESGKDHYLSGDYQEADVRKDFVDKFFTALGWDVNHDEQTNPYAQEVKVERGVNEGSARKRADYAFSLAPNYKTVRFYVEAKRPSKDFGSADNCHQAINYGWFTKRTSPFSVLTSFEDFYIVDSRLKPNINDTLSRIVERFSYTDYVDREKFARIYWLFSREAVAGGSLEKFAASRPIAKGKKFQRGLFKGGDVEPDEAFLEELDGYRQQLAQAFKRANPDLDGETLTEVTQRTLDRLVFTRFLEDKGIESPVIENFGKADGFWEDFINASLRLDRKYNGVVFKFHPRLDAKGFKPDEKVFARICEELSAPTSPYNFNIIPIHILGSIYERFLGKVISDGARVVEKPEVRKAGGVYYTPEYIVRYIVENTVGKMIEGKTPEEISKLKFADIACGSGSFLLGVYDVLLKYHAEYFSKNPGKVHKGDCVRRDGTLHLSLQKKRDILTNNLFGVDIDRQAVEVAQLSLYLKLLEDETVGTTSEFQDEFHFTLLPSLDKNIVCGNSLIGLDIADGGALTDEEEKKINPLDYAQRFPTIFRRKVSGGELREAAPGDVEHNYPGGVPLHGSYGKVSYKKSKKEKAAPPRVPESEYEGGFDAIVGNPPYVMVEDGMEKKYLQRNFETDEGKPDLYKYFIERSHKLLSFNGRFGMIIPASMLMTPAYKRCREFLLRCSSPITVVSFQGQVFESAQVNSIILVTKNRAGNERVNWIEDATPHPTGQSLSKAELEPATISISSWKNADGFAFMRPKAAEATWVVRMKEQSQPLGSFGKYVLGMQIYHNSLHSKSEMENRIYHSASSRGKGWLPESGGRNIRRYEFISEFQEWVKYGDHCYHKPPPEFLSGPRLIVREITGKTLICAYTEEEHAPNKAVIVFRSDKTNLKFILGVLNSRLIGCYVEATTEKGKQRLFPRISLKSFRELPIPQLDLNTAADKTRHDRLVGLVEQMLAAKAKLPSAKTEGERDRLENKCAMLDQQIDALVYQLYGLTDAEIKLVEGS